MVSASCFGTLGVLVRYADDAGVSTLTLTTWRAGVGAICVFLFLLARTMAGQRATLPWRSLPAGDRRFVGAAAVINAAVNLAAFIAFLRVGIALTLLVFYVYPAFVALASATWFNDRLDRLRLAALGVSLAGVVLVVAGAGPLGDLDLLGIGLALGAAVGQTFYALSARHGFSATPGTQAAALMLSGATLIYLALGLITGQLAAITQPLTSVSALWPVLLAGVIGAGIPTVCFIAGVRLLGAPRATILSTLEPVVGVGLAALLFSEPPTVVQVLGGVLIIAAGVMLQLRGHGELAEHEAVAAAETSG